ncbi:MAG: DUF6431 domain-containing protein [Erysipelotrichaceae bacterium]
MIIAKTNSKFKYNHQKSYNDLICSINLNTIQCPCGHDGCFIIHGYYQRYVLFHCVTIRIRILRVRCIYCNVTHAILVESMVPYSLLSADDIILALTDPFCFECSHVYYLRHKYKQKSISYESICLSNCRQFPCFFITT